MITKISKLLGIGTLHEPLPKGALTLSQKTIIFGENGRGKSTFVTILRSLSHGTGDVLRGRATIGGTHAPVVELLMGNKLHAFKQTSWNEGHENVSIFDAVFVAENVYAGATVETDQRKNLLNFSLGIAGVKLAQKVDALAQIIRDDGNAEKDAARLVQSHIVGTLSLDAFSELSEPDASIESELAEARIALAAQTQASTLKELQALSPINFEGPDVVRVREILGSSIDSISSAATASLKAHCESTGITEEWIVEGFQHVAAGNCPFCAVPLSESTILPTYQACFSVAYKEHKESISAGLANTQSLFSLEIEEAIRRVVELNTSRVAPWKQFIPDISLTIDLATTRKLIGEGRKLIKKVSKSKLADPLLIVILSEEENETLAEVQELITTIDDYNAQVVFINDKITKLKSAVEHPDVVTAQSKVDKILSRISRHKPQAIAAVEVWRKAKQAKTDHEAEKIAARAALDKYGAAIPDPLIKSINVHLKGCGTQFKVTSLKQVYTGATPRFDYVIELRGRRVDLTGKATDDIVFGTALSQGDKSALAFAFFLARLENDPTLKNQIVVFDDPLSSLDSCRRRYTRKKIAELADNVSQLIVLSHEELTVADLADFLSEDECCMLKFADKGDFTVITPTSVKELTASEYVKCFDRMQHFMWGDGVPESVVKDIRPFLEMNLRYRFPEHFKPVPLGKMISQIREAPSSSDLHRMQLNLPLLEEVNDFCVGHSHGDGALEKTENILPNDLKEIISKALEFARGFPVGKDA